VGVHLRHLVVAGRERRVAGQELEQHAAERVDVRARVDAVAADLLGGDVVEGADEGTGRGHPGRCLDLAREPEVGQVDVLAGAALDQDVARLDVAVNESALVRRVERRGDLGDDRGRVLGRQRPPRPQQPAQVGAVDQVHGHEQQPVLLAGVMDRDHVRVADRDRDPRLLAEAAPEALVLGQGRRDHLQRDHVVEREVGGAIDDAHPALARNALDSVPGEDRAGLELRHG